MYYNVNGNIDNNRSIQSYSNTIEIIDENKSSQSYTNILKNLDILLMELKMIEELRRSYSLSFISDHGFISVNREFIKKSIKDNTFQNKDMGKVLMTGFGVCRNTQSFHIDFFDIMKIKSLYIRGELLNTETKKMEKHALVLRELHDNDGNSRYILYDLINSYVFEILKRFNIHSYDDQKFIISEDSIDSILYEGNYDTEKVYMDLNRNISPFYDNGKLPIIQEEVNDTLNTNMRLLKDFYSANYYDISVVANYINKTLKLK